MNISKTYFLSQETVDKIDELSEKQGRKKKFIIERAIKIYEKMDEATINRLIGRSEA